MIEHSRGYLPHWETNESTYFLTFRTHGSLPASLIAEWRDELEALQKRQNLQLDPDGEERLKYLLSERIEEYLDSSQEKCFMRDPQVADIVKTALQYFDGQRYALHAWCVMPNHVHTLFTPIRKPDTGPLDSLLIPILHSWKSYTANQANKVLNRTGSFWQEEYFDTIVRSQQQFEFYIKYILMNPVKAGLCRDWKEWRWCGVSSEISKLLE